MVTTRIVERQSDLQKTGRDFDAPDTKAEVDLDGITGTDTSGQIEAPPQGDDMGSEMGAEAPTAAQRPTPQDIPDTALDTGSDDLSKDSDIMANLADHPYIELFDANPESQLNPMKIANMDKTALLELKSKIEQISMGHELRKKIGLYKDTQYQLISSLKAFISDVLSYK